MGTGSRRGLIIKPFRASGGTEAVWHCRQKTGLWASLFWSFSPPGSGIPDRPGRWKPVLGARMPFQRRWKPVLGSRTGLNPKPGSNTPPPERIKEGQVRRLTLLNGGEMRWVVEFLPCHAGWGWRKSSTRICGRIGFVHKFLWLNNVLSENLSMNLSDELSKLQLR